jgi:hypothetical protein
VVVPPLEQQHCQTDGCDAAPEFEVRALTFVASTLAYAQLQFSRGPALLSDESSRLTANVVVFVPAAS